MSRHALQAVLATVALLASLLPAGAKTARPAPYRIEALKGDAFTVPTVLESDFGGDFVRVGYVPAAASDQAAAVLQASVPPAPQQELTFAHDGRTLKYFAVGDPSKPAKAIFVYVHGFGADRSQGMDETKFGGNFARLKRLVAVNGGIYLSPDFSGFGREAEGQIAALIADHVGRSPGAPVFVACISYGGGLCWRLAEAADETSPLRGVLVLGASVDRGFLKRKAVGRPHIYLGIGTRDSFASSRSAEAFYKQLKTADPGYPIKLTIFDAGEHGTAIRLTDWTAVLNWMLDEKGAKPIATSVAAGPPCPRPRPGPDGRAVSSYCGRP
jgi:predicted esterase